ncbi:MAG: glycosyltransferase family 4 protein [Verrucomicrobiaceae bacterium]
MPRLVIHFERYGPYHHARLQSAREALEPRGWEVIGLEVAGDDEVYGWEVGEGAGVVRVFEEGSYQSRFGWMISRKVTQALEELKPDAVAIAGYASPDARACLKWCRKAGARAILMSETREADGVRVWWKELLKKRIVGQFDAALVGARSHAKYLDKLGLKEVYPGYNVVDNAAFFRVEEKSRPPVLLASNRFVERKNLGALIAAFKVSDLSKRWSLCLLGDGELKAQLRELAEQFKECAPWEDDEGKPTIYFPGFRQMEELPKFYATASAFIHPALQEPWGLVINEAMAVGLPILSSQNVGAAEELVEHGVNGWVFNADNATEMRIYLGYLDRADAEDLRKMGLESIRILKERALLSYFGLGMAGALGLK